MSPLNYLLSFILITLRGVEEMSGNELAFSCSVLCKIVISVSFLPACFLWFARPVKGELEPTTLPPCLVPTREEKVLHAPSETVQTGIKGRGRKQWTQKEEAP